MAKRKKRGPSIEISHTFLAVLVILIAGSLYMLSPYTLIVLEALTATAILYPTYQRVRRHVKNEYAAGLATLGTATIVLLVASAILVSGLYSQTVSARASLTRGLTQFEDVAEGMPWLSGLADRLAEAGMSLVSSFSRSIISGIPSYLVLAGNVITHVILLFIAVFYLLVDGPAIYQAMTAYSEDEGDSLRSFLAYSEEMVTALIQGLIGVSVIKALSNGAMLWLAGIGSPLFWTMAMLILGIIPLVGPFLVWFPAAVYAFIFIHPAAGLAIVAWGFITDQVADNVVYPKLVSHERKVHPLIVIFGVFAGLTTYGIAGVILGPLIFSLTLAVLVVYLKLRRCRWDDEDGICDLSIGKELKKATTTE